MKSVSGKQPARAVERHGWQCVRIKGSHHIYTKQGSPIRLSVPIHANHPLKRGLFVHLLKQVGLTEEDL